MILRRPKYDKNRFICHKTYLFSLIIITRERNYEEKMDLTIVHINVDTGPIIDVVLAVDNSQNQPENDQGGLENAAKEFGILFPKETSNSVAKKFKKVTIKK